MALPAEGLRTCFRCVGPDIAAIDPEQCMALLFAEALVGPDRVLGCFVVQVLRRAGQAGVLEQRLCGHVQRLTDRLEHAHRRLMHATLDLAQDGLETSVSTDSWRSDRFASCRCARMNS